MNQFEESLHQILGQKKLAKIQNVTVGIGGAGGLGSNCAFNLVRSGFKSLVIVDFDSIESSNLNRQFYFTEQIGTKKVHALKNNLLHINPDLELEIKDTKVTPDNINKLFKDCDIIVEAFDEVTSKKLIVEEYMNSNKLLVAATGLAGWGNSDQIKIKKVKDKFYLVGDSISEANESNPPLSPKVNITAAKEADIILNYVLEEE
ncbi:sulfur carrier protein ThiS adenylyltransferase ThiF [Sporohalobacter salinus]|uniref:sulfur carrier protein ThiS adenylyltransferase ThiF n=1 Tax=Sporohalobacter salinus TaxID=1494606 RepID=UPI0019600110|nr:sulfur carrier protein ThiS adenylyltransferase ThiF [Sporohalobacter salinus]MBM7622479.1 sulfur carrier protein ThiS adenylyltransferase [Sporohalobacter salinus]